MVLGGLLALVLAIHTPAAKRHVLSRIESMLLAQGVRLESEALDYRLGPSSLQVTLRQVRVSSEAARDLPPFLTAQRVEADLNVWRAFGRDVVLNRLDFEDLHFEMVVTGDGRNNLPKASERDETSSPWRFLVSQAAGNGALRYDDQKSGVAADVPAWTLKVKGDELKDAHDVDWRSTGPAAVTVPVAGERRVVALDALGVKARVLEDGVDVQELRLASKALRAAASGEIRDFEKPNLNLTAKGTVDLAEVSALAGQAGKARGEVGFESAVNGTLDQLKGRLTLQGDGLAADRFGDLSLRAALGYDGAGQRVAVESMEVSGPVGRGSLKGTVALAEGAGATSLSGAAAGLDLAAISRGAGLPVVIASSGAVTYSAEFPALRWEAGRADARVTLASRGGGGGQNVIAVGGQLAARMADGRTAVNLNGVEALGTRVSGDVAVAKNGALSGDLAGEVSDVAIAAAHFGYASARVAGGGVVRGAISGSTGRPEAAVVWDGPAMVVGDLKPVATSVAATYRPDQLTVESARVEWRGQSVAAAGTVGLAGREPALDLAFQVRNVQVAEALGAMGKGDLPVSGAVTGDGTVRGTAGKPLVDGSLLATGLVAYAETMGSATARLRVDGGKVHLDPLVWTKAQGAELKATGVYDPASGAYTLDVASTEIPIERLVLPDGRVVRGVATIRANGAGTLAEPGGTADLSATGLALGADELGAARARVELAGGEAKFQAQMDRFQLTAEGVAGIRAPYPLQATVVAAGTDLSALPAAWKLPVTGTLTGQVTVAGDGNDWQRGRMEARLEPLDLEWNGRKVRSDGTVEFSIADSRARIGRAEFAMEESRLSVRGELPLTAGAAAGRIETEATLDLAEVAELIPDALDAASGRLEVRGEVTGTAQRVAPVLNATVKDAMIAPVGVPAVTGLSLAASAADGTLVVQGLTGTWAGGAITGSAEVPFGLLPELPVELARKGGAARASVRLEGLDVAKIPGAPEGAGGTVSARLEAEAARPELAALTARLTVDTAKLNLGGLALEQAAPGEIRIVGQRLTVEQFHMTGPSTDIRLSGTAGLAKGGALDLRLTGSSDLAVLSTVQQDIRASGAARIDVAAKGTLSDPKLAGAVNVTDGFLTMASPDLRMENVQARIDLAGDRVSIGQLAGDLNGGPVEGEGGFRIAKGGISDADVKLRAKNVYLNYPEGLKTESTADLSLTSRGTTLVAGGTIRIHEGAYSEALQLEGGLLGYLRSSSQSILPPDRSAMLENLRFDIAVATESPLVIDNNLAKAATNLDVRLVGSFYQPALTGRVTVDEGAELYLRERKYLVERGTVTFTSEQRIEPMVDVIARTKAGEYDVQLNVQGGPDDLKTTLTSDPGLPEPDIIAVLLTGKTLDEARSAGGQVAANQALSYLAGGFADVLGRSAEQALGLTQVRIEPVLIAAESDPSARLTVGQDLTPELRLIYSMNLTDSSDQIYVAEYDVTRRFTTRGTRQADNTYRFDFRHDLRFGGVPVERAVKDSGAFEDRTVRKVDITGNPLLSEEELAGKFKVKAGKRYDFFQVRGGVDRVEKLYFDKDLLEAKVRLRREVRGRDVDLNLVVQAGPKIEFVYEGGDVSGGVKKKVREIWTKGVFDTQRAEEAVDAIRLPLVKDGYLKSEVTYAISGDAESKRVLFEIHPGPKFQNVEIVFEGARAFENRELLDLLDGQDLKEAIYTKPGAVRDLLARYYQTQGYLDAAVQAPRYELDEATLSGRTVIPVSEGELYTIGSIAFEGNSAIPEPELRAALALPDGSPFRPAVRDAAISRLRAEYLKRGYNDVVIGAGADRVPESSSLGLKFEITENEQSRVTEIAVEGTDQTTKDFVLGQLALKPGDVLSVEDVGQSRGNLYNTGAFSLVDIQRELIPGMAEAQGQNAYRLNVNVREVRPFELRYGGFVDTERGPGFIADFANRNTLGGGRVIGLRTRYDSDIREGRLYFSQPLLRSLPLKSTATVFSRRELMPTFLTDRVGFTVQQETRFKRHYIFNYGYRFEWVHTYEKEPDPFFPFDVTLRIAPLTGTFTRDSRDDVLDATRGSFLSHAVEYAPDLLGSQLSYMKYFGQYFKYVPLKAAVQKPLQARPARPRLVYAGAVRMGLAGGLQGQELISSERFFAGGGTSLRGFQQNTLGPIEFGEPTGGNAVFVVNNELRFPAVSILDGVGFVDIGNVYPRIRDFDLADIRKVAGVGVRVRTPYFLLRVDYGFKLDRRPDERRGQWFFSIGQAF